MHNALPEIIAHRGASTEAPENSLAAFRLAFAYNANGIEGDFRLTADGQLVCCHDASLSRCFGKPHKVANTSLTELQAAAGSASALPSLAEVMGLLPDEKRLFIELKTETPGDTAVIKPLTRAFSNMSHNPSQLHIIAFDPALVAASKHAFPDIEASLLTAEDTPIAQYLHGSKALLEKLNEISANGASLSQNLVTQTLVERLHAHGFCCHCWTVDEPDTAQTFADWGIDSITTNVPKHIISTVTLRNS